MTMNNGDSQLSDILTELRRPLSEKLPCYGMAIGRGYSVLAYSERRVTYEKDGIKLEIWDSGLFDKVLVGQMSFITPNQITVSTATFPIPDPKFDEFEEQIREVQTALKGIRTGA